MKDIVITKKEAVVELYNGGSYTIERVIYRSYIPERVIQWSETFYIYEMMKYLFCNDEDLMS